MQFASFGVLLLVIGFLAPFILHSAGAGWTLSAVAAAVPLGIAAWIFRLMSHGGVRVTGDQVTISGWFSQRSIPVASVRSVIVRRDAADEPAGWLDLGDREAFLRGVTSRHRHNLFEANAERTPGRAAPCSVCKEQLASLEQIASQLGVPISDGGRRRGLVSSDTLDPR